MHRKWVNSIFAKNFGQFARMQISFTQVVIAKPFEELHVFVNNYKFVIFLESADGVYVKCQIRFL